MMERIMRITGRFMQPFIELLLIPKPNHLFPLHRKLHVHTHRQKPKRKRAFSHAGTRKKQAYSLRAFNAPAPIQHWYNRANLLALTNTQHISSQHLHPRLALAS